MTKMIEWIDFLSEHIPFVNKLRKRSQRQRDKKEVIEKKKLKIFIGTWNMHGKLPPYKLSPFIEPPAKCMEGEIKDYFLKRNSKHPYHVLVIGTQECQHNIKHSVFFP